LKYKKQITFLLPYCSWNRENEEAWHAIFKFITFFLKLGYGGLELINKEQLKLTEENFGRQNLNADDETS
jgi:hypothetical protein